MRLMKRIKEMSRPTLAAFIIILAGCGAATAAEGLDRIDEIMNKSETKAKVFVPQLPDGSSDFQNYNAANKLFADPSTIIWCTTTWGNPSAPLITFPVTRKLTSSSVSFYPSSRVKIASGGDYTNEYTPERRSIDGMYHGSPPPYRYGFTPGGQYVDLFNMPTFCTTAMTKFQRQKTELSSTLTTDAEAATATDAAEEALKRGDKAGAQKILDDALGQK